MRVLGFSKKWPKLLQPSFTTFRFSRRDRDWEVEELVQIVIQPRSKGGGERLGTAEIMSKELRRAAPFYGLAGLEITKAEAIEDGFGNQSEMIAWLIGAHGFQRVSTEQLNKLSLRWIDG